MASIKPFELRWPTAPLITGRASGRLLAFVLAAAITSPGLAANPDPSEAEKAVMAKVQHQQKVEKTQRESLLAQCGLSAGSVRYPGWLFFDGDPIPTWQTDFAVKSWTGGCLDGKRDGQGVLVTREDQTEETTVLTTLEKSEGRFVRGRRLGLWCFLESQNFTHTTDDNKTERRSDGQTGCRLLDDAGGSGFVAKRPDGRWQAMDWGNKPASPEVVLDAGVVEAESERLIKEAAAGKTGLKVKPFTVQSDALDGLIAGARLRTAYGNSVVSLAGKRVALILSNRSIAEIDSYTQRRLAFINATANLPPPSRQAKSKITGADAALEAMTGPVNETMVQRARFIDVSRPELLLKRVATTLRRYAREVVPVEDLSGLSKGEFDYALVLDWQSTTRFDLLGKYKSVPVAPANTLNEPSRIVGQVMGGFLISPKLEVVSYYSAYTDVDVKSVECVQTRQEDSCDRDYLKALADFYAKRWTDTTDQFDRLNQWFSPR
jgi:hypothetical protein